MRIHYIQHVPFEDAANIAPWAEQNGHQLTTTRLYASQRFPDPSEIDFLVLLGGFMNIYEHRKYPWLVPEKKFIEKTIAKDKLVLGVCLGAQLLADVLGGKVFKNSHSEIGFWPVELTRGGRDCELFTDLPDSFIAFHWHGDAFDLPPATENLASTETCRNQAFSYGDNVLALQFHLEYSQQSIEKMLTNCPDELQNGPFIQTEKQIRAGFPHIATTREMLFGLLDKMTRTQTSNS